jgi:hypothetical protein
MVYAPIIKKTKGAPAMYLFKHFITSALLAVSGAAAATPIMVNFEDVGGFGSTLTSHGYTFSPATGFILSTTNASCGVSPCAANNTNDLYVPQSSGLAPASTAPLTMVSAASGAFILNGLDFAEFISSSAASASLINATSLQLIGDLVGGATVTQTLLLDGIVDGPSGANDFQAAVLSGFWSLSPLLSLRFTGFNAAGAGGGFVLDNIAVATAVPEPATLLLFAGALGAIALGRKRRAVTCRRPIDQLNSLG